MPPSVDPAPWPLQESTSTPEETEALGARLAEALAPGDLVLIDGDLGAGKTTLVRGASRGLGVDAVVNSPTFTLGQRYRGRVGVSHIDLFRLTPDPAGGGEAVAEEPGVLDDYLDPGSVVFVEWPHRAGELLAGREPSGRVIRVGIRHGGGDRRSISVVEERAAGQ